MAEVYIRSYNDFAHKFELKSGTVIIPSIVAKPKNVATISEQQYEELCEVDSFNALMKAKKGQFIKLDSMPRDAIDAQERIARAEDSARDAKEEAEALKVEAENAKLEADKLRKQIEELGGLTVSVDSKVSDANAERDLAQEELDRVKAELAELKAKIKDE